VELRDLLKSGSLAVIAVIVAFYICGWQYYVGFFHALGVKIHFFIPPESAIGAGMQPMVTLLGVPLLGCSLGLVWSRLSQRRPWLKRRPLLASAAAAVAVLPLPWIVEVVEGWRFDTTRRAVLTLLGALIATLAATVGRRRWMRAEPNRYYYYFSICLCFVIAACVYSGFRGDAFARSSPQKADRALAAVRFENEELQRQCGDALFLPLLSIGDDLFLLAISSGPGSPTTGLCAMPNPASRPLIIVKRSLIQMLSLVRQGSVDRGATRASDSVEGQQ
jgi:hypothetical protein